MGTVNSLAPLLVLVVLPVVWLAHRLGWWRIQVVRVSIITGAAMAAIWLAPWDGLTIEAVKRCNLALVVATLAVVVGHVRGWGWLARDRGYVAVLAGLAFASIMVYWNFFAFHGARTFTHLHDVGHYYLGSKYFDELGYDRLYTAMLRAEAEAFDDRFTNLEARDLSSGDLVHVRVLLERSGPVKAAFDEARWQSFTRDVTRLRERLGTRHAGIYVDHGFNATPLWAFVGGWLANRVPAGSDRGLLALTLIDPLLWLVTLLVLGRVFGAATALLTLIYLCVAYGATFGWVGGAFMRYGWWAALVVGLCALHRRRGALAGAALAVATLLRVFPVFFVVGWCAFAWRRWRRPGQRLDRSDRRFAIAFMATSMLLIALTASAPRGLEAWRGFFENSRTYVEAVSPNIIGMTPLLAYAGRPGPVSVEQFVTIKARRATIHRAQQLLIFLPLLVLLFRFGGGRASDRTTAAVVAGLSLAFAAFNLAAYYWVFLALLLLTERHVTRAESVRSLDRAAIGIFVVESAVYGLQLFEPAEGMVFLYRSVLIAYLLVWRLVGSSGSGLGAPASSTTMRALSQTTP